MCMCVCCVACMCFCVVCIIICILQNLFIKDTLRLGYGVLYNGTSLSRTTGNGVIMVPHR